jgi:hypothetical protein
METLDSIKRELLKVHPYEELHYGGPLNIVDWRPLADLAQEIRRLDEVLDGQANRMRLAGQNIWTLTPMPCCWLRRSFIRLWIEFVEPAIRQRQEETR